MTVGDPAIGASGLNPSGYPNTPSKIRVSMAQLRQKLEDDSARPKYLTTEPGVGYRLRID